MFHEMFHSASRFHQGFCGLALCAVLLSCSSTDASSTTTGAGGRSGAQAGAGASGAGVGVSGAGGVGDSGAGGVGQSGGSTGLTAGAGGAAISNAGASGENAAGGAAMDDGGASAEDAGAMDANAADAASCVVGCMPRFIGGVSYCQDDEVEWICEGSADEAPFIANCSSVPINSIRYCCPATFLAQCQ